MAEHYFVTGGAGFIASNLIDRLLADGHQVTAYDNLTTGFRRFLDEANQNSNFQFVEGNLLDRERLTAAMKDANFVAHLAANADVRFGTHHPHKDLEQNTIATFNVLEAMRANSVKRIAFASTGAIYGDHRTIPTPEDAPFPIQTSLYGASKLAGEGLIQAYCEGFGFQGWIFRFVSILGARYTHGHIFDFYSKLLANPSELHVLGNGEQRKSYMVVSDCVSAITTAIAKADSKVNILNLGTDSSCNIKQSIGWICARLNLTPKVIFAGGERGWIGDSPLVHLDTTRIRNLGWEPQYTIQQGVERTVDWLTANRWAFEQRS